MYILTLLLLQLKLRLFLSVDIYDIFNFVLIMFKLVLEKAEEPEVKLPASAGSWKKEESSRKTSVSAL